MATANINIVWSDIDEAREIAYREHIRQLSGNKSTESQLDRIERKLNAILDMLAVRDEDIDYISRHLCVTLPSKRS